MPRSEDAEARFAPGGSGRHGLGRLRGRALRAAVAWLLGGRLLRRRLRRAGLLSGRDV